jgi:hypothetical protein
MSRLGILGQLTKIPTQLTYRQVMRVACVMKRKVDLASLNVTAIEASEAAHTGFQNCSHSVLYIEAPSQSPLVRRSKNNTFDRKAMDKDVSR